MAFPVVPSQRENGIFRLWGISSLAFYVTFLATSALKTNEGGYVQKMSMNF